MAEYIEREAALNVINENKSSTELAWISVSKIPAADVAPVVHGHWIICSDGYYPYCSRCKEEPSGRKMTKYCDHCGAKMDEVSSDE